MLWRLLQVLHKETKFCLSTKFRVDEEHLSLPQQQHSNFTSSIIYSVSLMYRSRASCWSARNVILTCIWASSYTFPPGLDGRNCRQMEIPSWWRAKFQFLFLSKGDFNENFEGKTGLTTMPNCHERYLRSLLWNHIAMLSYTDYEEED